MTDRLFSPEWHRVAELTPRLRPHAEIHRHVYRGQPWYVLDDPAAGRLHRFTPAANLIIGLMDGKRTVAALWNTACERLGDDAPTQDQVIELLTRLHRADLLQSQARPDAEEAGRRHERGARARVAQRMKNPLALRIPLLDPDRLLDRMRPLARLLFNRVAGAAWLALVLAGLAVAGGNAGELATHAATRAFTGHNLLLLLLVFPCVKLLHELGHGLAVKRWEGPVREAGVMLLVLAPLPYVDASGSAAFSDKWRRITVAAAGIAVELALAAVAAFVWAGAAPGLVRDVAFDVMLIGGVSTLLFNGNPLLRFDGYYILADLLEIPNLAQRARRYLGYLVLRHLFRARSAQSPVTAPGEAVWFVAYGIAAALYRILIAVTIIAFVAGRFFILGIVLAAIAAVQMLLAPLLKQIHFLARSPLLAGRRAWALALTGTGVVAAAALLALAPAPLVTRAEGVVWLPEDAQVRAGAQGFVRATHARPGDRVRRGQVLFELEDPLREAQRKVLEARLAELQVERAVNAFHDRVKAGIIDDQIREVRAELERESELAGRLVVRSPADGHLVWPGGEDPVGRYVRQGDELAVVLDREGLSVRAVVEQPDIALVRERLESVQVRFADRVDRTLAARLVREVPAAHYMLPSRVLGTDGGGRIPVEPSDARGLKVTRKVFQVELELPGAPLADVGQRVHVRFGHGAEPLAWQWGRRLEQVFLRGLGV